MSKIQVKYELLDDQGNSTYYKTLKDARGGKKILKNTLKVKSQIFKQKYIDLTDTKVY